MKILIALILQCVALTINSQVQLVPAGGSWRYFDQGNIGTPLWNTVSFNATSWAVGNAQLGYGEGDETTVVSYGTDANNKHITTYFRHELNVVNPQQFSHLELNLLRDDGAVVYINGVEVWRSNMGAGVISHGTLADGTVAWPNENNWYTTNISASFLQNGLNVVAVEIHQESASSSDIGFDFSMIAHSNLIGQVVRGPYLQKATQTSMTVMWRTDVPTDSRVNFGNAPGNLNLSVTTPVFTNDHSITITGLQPETQYFYSIGTFNQVLVGSPNLFFETLPPVGKEDTYEFIVLGDCGTGYQEQLDVKDAVIAVRGTHYDGMILLGDNAYQSGFDSDYQNNFFTDKYNEIIENTVIWPCPGNHDYNNNIPFSPDPAYYNIFDLPAFAESGGLQSGTEHYYSFDIGNVHFISLDSYKENRSASAPMATWMQADLTANTLPWVVAFWHHPPYTKGSHDSDNDNFLDGELVDMREEIVPILESFDVDLVLNGHSHSYERTHCIGNHYGDSDSFGPQLIKSPGTGDYPYDCPYLKSTENNLHDGTVYCVAGNAGKVTSVDSEWPHPAMISYAASEVGALFLNVDRNRMDVTFLTSGGFDYDHFTIVKDAGGHQTVETCINEPVTLEPSWPTYAPVTWFPGGNVTPTYTISSITNASVYATDLEGCIADTFHLVVLQNDTCGYLELVSEELNGVGITASYASNVITIIQDGDVIYTEFDVLDLSGRLVEEITVNASIYQHYLQNPINSIFLLKPKNSELSLKLLRYD